MKTWLKVLIVTVIIASPAIPLGQAIWPPAPGEPAPTGAQLPFLIVLAIVESIVLGLGVSFLAFGWPLMRRFSSSPRLALASFLSISWLMISWWPHDGLHRSNGMNMGRLLFIEYGFHLTLIIAALILAYAFLSVARATGTERDRMPVPGKASASQASPQGL